MINPGYEIKCAIEEVTIWIDQHDSNGVPARINDHLAVISGDSDFITEMISGLGVGCRSPKVYDTRETLKKTSRFGEILSSHELNGSAR